MTAPTPYADLNLLLEEVARHADVTFGADHVGTYVVGSFAVGDGDEHSDCDFLVVVRATPSGAREQAVRDLWAELPTRSVPGHWHHDLEGSYADVADLGDLGRIGRPWLYVDRGHTGLEWDAHDNVEVVRWTLHERGVPVSGPDPRTFTAEVPADLVRDRMRRDLPGVLTGILAWAPTDVAWTQRYVVATYCRTLYSLVTGQVASKRASLEWAMAELDPRWRALLTQVRDDRALGWQPDQPPPPGSLGSAYEFATWCEAWGAGR